MGDDMDRLVRAAARVWPDEARGEYALTGYRIDEAAKCVVEAVLEALRIPSEEAATAGGRAASAAMMSFRPHPFCGLAAIQGAIDHILAEDDEAPSPASPATGG